MSDQVFTPEDMAEADSHPSLGREYFACNRFMERLQAAWADEHLKPLADALAAQSRVIAERRAETITELRRHEAECCMCGEGPADRTELRMFDPAPGWTQPTMICAACWTNRGEESDFRDAPLVWAKIEDANR